MKVLIIMVCCMVACSAIDMKKLQRIKKLLQVEQTIEEMKEKVDLESEVSAFIREVTKRSHSFMNKRTLSLEGRAYANFIHEGTQRLAMVLRRRTSALAVQESCGDKMNTALRVAVDYVYGMTTELDRSELDEECVKSAVLFALDSAVGAGMTPCESGILEYCDVFNAEQS